MQNIIIIPLFIVFLTFHPNVSHALDSVAVRQNADSNVVTINGKIVEYSGISGLVIVTQANEKHSIPLEQIVNVTPERLQVHKIADEAFTEKRDYVSALALYEDSRKQESPPERKWIRNLITAQIARCYTALGKQTEASNEFFVLCRSDLFTPHLEAAPLLWFPPSGRTSFTATPLETAAARLLDNGSTSPPALLLVSSILAVSPVQELRSRGIEQLRYLSRPPEKTQADNEQTIRVQVARLATALLWRTQYVVTSKNFETIRKERENIINALPQNLRAGAYYLLADAYYQRNENEQAVINWMRLPILYPENRPLAARSLQDSARALRQLGRTEQAESLLREVANQYKEFTDGM
ncbi:MAG: hypothetical protein LBU65_08875 [Planctomycetaceae bacterium]|nr:hypothetical protein [Planctomycetaceae bacterium]